MNCIVLGAQNNTPCSNNISTCQQSTDEITTCRNLLIKKHTASSWAIKQDAGKPKQHLLDQIIVTKLGPGVSIVK